MQRTGPRRAPNAPRAAEGGLTILPGRRGDVIFLRAASAMLDAAYRAMTTP